MHQSPNLQTFVERVVQALKHEIIHPFCIVNEQPLDHILTRGAAWYNNRRCHSERDSRTPIRDKAEPEVVNLATRRIECVEELGGQLKAYRVAAKHAFDSSLTHLCNTHAFTAAHSAWNRFTLALLTLALLTLANLCPCGDEYLLEGTIGTEIQRISVWQTFFTARV